MADDSQFLAAIAADPRDAALRQVYADWLEERGDPRGEFIRLEDAARQHPVFADGYWSHHTLQFSLFAVPTRH
jgi:uncharacterized protein (TIGR02996 family)